MRTSPMSPLGKPGAPINTSTSANPSVPGPERSKRRKPHRLHAGVSPRPLL